MLRHAPLVALAVLLAPACSRRAEPPGDAAPSAKPSNAADLPDAPTAERTYTLYFNAQKDAPEGGVTVVLSPPTDWTATVDPTGGPVFGGNGLAYGPTVVLLPVEGPPKARIEKWVSRHYDAAALAAAEREDSPSAVFIVSRRADGYVDARRYLAAPGDDGVLSCVITLTPREAARLEVMRRVCSTLRVRAGQAP